MKTWNDLLDGDDYSDWRYAAECAGLNTAEVEEVIASADGENDGESWIALLRLSGGRVAFMTAWCDYTGWGCQDGGEVTTHTSLQHLCQMVLSEDDRQRLGYDVFGNRAEI